MLISLTSLVSTDKIQKKSSFRTRLVGLINIKSKEYFFGRHLRILSILFLKNRPKPAEESNSGIDCYFYRAQILISTEMVRVIGKQKEIQFIRWIEDISNV